MRKSKADFVELLASGAYYVLQKKHDRNLDDIALKREDGGPEEIQNYPYRLNQLPTYIFLELLAEGFLREAGAGDHGTVFRPAGREREPSQEAA
jgi:hypothetical protein